MSLRIVPSATHPTTTSNTTHLSASAPSAPGLHDTLRHNLSLQAASTTNTNTPTSSHPLESRLAAWHTTQQSLKHNLLRRNFGMGEPIRREMELKICREGEWRPAALGGSAAVGGEILGGRDERVEWEDVFGRDGMGVREGGVGEEMERRGGVGGL